MPRWLVPLLCVVAFAGCGGASAPPGRCADEAPSAGSSRVVIPSTDCAARPPTRCTATDTAAGSPLTSLDTLAIGPCGGPGSVTLRIEVTGGCPTLLEASAQTPTDGRYLACLATLLSKLRFDCAAGTTCSTLDFSLTPPQDPVAP